MLAEYEEPLLQIIDFYYISAALILHQTLKKDDKLKNSLFHAGCVLCPN